MSGLPQDIVRQTDALRDALRTLDLVNSPAVKAATEISRQLEAARIPHLDTITRISEQLDAFRLPAVEGATRISRQIEAAKAPQIAAVTSVARQMEQLRLPRAPVFGMSGGGSASAEAQGSDPATSGRTATRHPVLSVADLGWVLKAARMRMGLTQQELADVAGVGRRFVSELEAGKPTLEAGKVLLVCASVGVDLFAAAR